MWDSVTSILSGVFLRVDSPFTSLSICSVQTGRDFGYDFYRVDFSQAAAFSQPLWIEQDDGLFLHLEQTLRFQRFQRAA